MQDRLVHHILESASLAYKEEFEAALRKRLLDLATAEIEHIVREVSDKVSVGLTMYVEQHERCLQVEHKVTIRGTKQ